MVWGCFVLCLCVCVCVYSFAVFKHQQHHIMALGARMPVCMQAGWLCFMGGFCHHLFVHLLLLLTLAVSLLPPLPPLPPLLLYPPCSTGGCPRSWSSLTVSLSASCRT